MTIYPGKKRKKKKHSEKKSEKHASRDVHLQIQWGITYPETATHIPRQRERKKYESRDVRIHAKWRERKIYSAITRWVSWTRLFIYMHIVDNISGCWNTKRDRERPRRPKRRTYTRTISYKMSTRTVIETFRKRDRETRIKKCTDTPTMSDSIAGHCKHIQTEWEQKKYESRDVPIHAKLRIWYPHTETDRETNRQREKRG